MTEKDILDFVKDYLQNAIKRSQDSKKILEELFPDVSQSDLNGLHAYFNGFNDGVIYYCEEVLDFINLLSK